MKYGPINIDPETMSGTPVFTGTRVPVQSLFDYIETGETLDEATIAATIKKAGDEYTLNTKTKKIKTH